MRWEHGHIEGATLTWTQILGPLQITTQRTCTWLVSPATVTLREPRNSMIFPTIQKQNVKRIYLILTQAMCDISSLEMYGHASDTNVQCPALLLYPLLSAPTSTASNIIICEVSLDRSTGCIWRMPPPLLNQQNSSRITQIMIRCSSSGSECPRQW